MVAFRSPNPDQRDELRTDRLRPRKRAATRIVREFLR
jgi:hypothetical protein